MGIKCSAHSKQTGEPCKQYVVPGKGVCHYHGARGGGPITTGRYSKVLGKYAPAYNESLEDPKLLDMRETLAVLDSLVKGSMARAESGDTPELRRRALACLDTANAAAVAGNAVSARASMIELERLLREGIAEDKQSREITRAVSKFQRAQESVWRLMLARQSVTNVGDQKVFFARILSILESEVGKDAALRVAVRFDREVMRGAAARALPAHEDGKE